MYYKMQNFVNAIQNDKIRSLSLKKVSGVTKSNVNIAGATLFGIYNFGKDARDNVLKKGIRDAAFQEVVFNEDRKREVEEAFLNEYTDAVVHKIVEVLKNSKRVYYVEFSDKNHFHNKVLYH